MKDLAACFRIALFGWTLLLIDPTPAVACTCMGGLPPCQTIWSADAVFEATVEAIEPQDPSRAEAKHGHIRERLVRLRDVHSWIGKPADAIVTGVGAGDCGYNFQTRTRYVIVAHRRPDGQLATSICSETKPVDEASALLAYLQTLSSPSAGAVVFGQLQVRRGRFAVPGAVPEVVSGVSIVLDGPVHRVTQTDAEGRYWFDRLPRGKYSITAEITRDRADLTPMRPQPVELPNEHACASPFLSTTINGRIVGNTPSKSGRPAAGVRVNARVAGPVDGWPTNRHEIPVHVNEAGRRRVEFTAGDEPITVIMKRFRR